MNRSTIDAVGALKLLKFEAESFAWIDVRSEGEFLDEHISGFRNFPILNNQDRHEVGLRYKQQGQEAAIQLGLDLTKARREEVVAAWLQEADGKPAIVGCWRGGLRSKFACDWMAEAKMHPTQLLGGYKFLRRELRSVLQRPFNFVVIGGLTGSNKTDLIQELPIELTVDLEKHAKHFGSAFGYHPIEPQPNQTLFENNLFFDLYFKNRVVFVEDESKMIGKVFVPPEMHEKMQRAPLIWVEASSADRAKNIFEKYVQFFLDQGISDEVMKNLHLRSLTNIQKKLGDQLFKQLSQMVEDAYAAKDPEAHQLWIKKLLLEYYDRRYEHAFLRSGRTKIFSGTREECKDWIMQRKENTDELRI